jgi:hypothetical protein
MIEVIGLIFLGIWAAGKAKQKGRNQYLWSLVPIGLYLIIYLATFLILNFGFGTSFSPTETFSLTLALFVRIALIPISFILSKFLLEELFKRMNDIEEKEKLD